jgi:hypothetical protein
MRRIPYAERYATALASRRPLGRVPRREYVNVHQLLPTAYS